jgi:hypothetical protein
MDRRILVLAIGMFAVGTDSFVVAGVLPEIWRSFHIKYWCRRSNDDSVCNHLGNS